MVEAKVSARLDASSPVREADAPRDTLLARFGADKPLKLDAGVELSPFQIAYKTYGTLNAARSNAVLICHALTGDQHVASVHPVTGKPGWWETLVGPGRPIDTERYFVICSNVVGGCMGTTGPSSTNAATGQAVGPGISRHHDPRHGARAGHAARSSRHRVAVCRCRRLDGRHAGAANGPRAIPQRVFAALPIACSTRHSAQNIAFHEVGRQAVMADPEWRGGRYLTEGTNPRRGLAVARMGAHITYLSDAALHRKFGRKFQDRTNPTFSFDADFEVESYLRYQGSSFVERFDANSYLYLTRAMDYFDLAADHDGVLANAFKNTPTRFCVVSFTSDWLFPTAESRAIVHALNAAGAPRLVRRDQDRQGARRLPARRAGIVRDRARLPRLRRARRAGSCAA